jgi:hypothetical protein
MLLVLYLIQKSKLFFESWLLIINQGSGKDNCFWNSSNLEKYFGLCSLFMRTNRLMRAYIWRCATKIIISTGHWAYPKSHLILSHQKFSGLFSWSEDWLIIRNKKFREAILSFG